MRQRSSAASAVVAAVWLAAAPGCGGGDDDDEAPSAPDAGAPAPDWDRFPDPVYACPAALATVPAGPPVVAPATLGAPVSRSFTVTIDPTAPALAGRDQQPLLDVAQVVAHDGADLQLAVAVKKPSQRPSLLWLELLVVDGGGSGLAEAELSVAGLPAGAALVDLDADVWGAATEARSFALGSVAPEGTNRYLLGVELAGAGEPVAPVSFEVTIAGTTGARAATSSAWLAVTPDGAELWAPRADADLVAVVDAAASTRLAQVPVVGAPRSVAITPDGALVLVAASGCNQLVVIDRATREPVQIFGEAEGIGREPRQVALSPDGTRAFVASYVGDSVTVLQRHQHGFAVAATVPVGRRPTALSVTPDGGTVFVAHFLPRGGVDDNAAWVTVIDAASATVLDEVELIDDSNPERIACLQLVPGFEAYAVDELKMESVPTLLWGAFLSPSGAELLVPGTRIVPFPLFEGDFDSLDLGFKQGSISTANIFSIDTHRPRAARVRQLDTPFEIPDRELDYLRCFDAGADIEFAVGYPDESDPEIVRVRGAIRPTGETPLAELGHIRSVRWSRGGRVALMLAYASSELAVIDGTTHHPHARSHFQLAGDNPVDLVVSPDGARAWVLYDNSTFLSVLDLSGYAAAPLPAPSYVPFWLEENPNPGGSASLVSFRRVTRDVGDVPVAPAVSELAQVALVDADAMDPLLRRGRILFNSANPARWPRLSVNKEAACVHCHPEGGNDGSVWPTMDGERRTLTLRGGVNGRGWLHASATHRNAWEFVDVVTRERFGGPGLDEADLQAMAEYLARGIPRLQRPRVDAMLAARGATLFVTHCAGCHAGPRLGSGNPDPADPYGGGAEEGPLLYDMNTATDHAGAIMGLAFHRFFTGSLRKMLDEMVGDRALGPDDYTVTTMQATPRPARPRGQFKANSLVNVWDNALFFHDGRLHRLEDAVAWMDQSLRLGLSTDDQRALVEFLKTL